jgi:hypothetical protein
MLIAKRDDRFVPLAQEVYLKCWTNEDVLEGTRVGYDSRRKICSSGGKDMPSGVVFEDAKAGESCIVSVLDLYERVP